MGYSLLNKFRGAWLGSVMGSQLATQHQAINIKSNDFLAHETRQFSEFALSILPLVLYHHDDWCNLSSLLTQKVRSRPRPHHVKSSSKSQAEIDNILVWSYTVRLALRGELASQGLSDRVMRGTRLEQAASIEWLKQVEVSCLQGFSPIQLIEALSPLENWELPLSLFCFLNNAEDFALTIQQALSLEKQATKITALSAIFSGAYNGLTAIPINWRNWSKNQEFYQKIMAKTEDMINEWLGIDSSVDSKDKTLVITAPKILQPRSNLRIISQPEY